MNNVRTASFWAEDYIIIDFRCFYILCIDIKSNIYENVTVIHRLGFYWATTQIQFHPWKSGKLQIDCQIQ